MYQNQTQDPSARNLAHGAANIGMVGGALAGAAIAPTAPRIQQQITELEKILASCHEISGDLDRSADRVCGSQPVDASKSPPQPEPNSVEARLTSLIGYADRLAQKLHSTSSRLNGAV